MSSETQPLKLQLANMRRALTTPAASILGYAELLSGAVAQAGLDGFEDDLARIRQAALELHAQVEALAEPSAMRAILAQDDVTEAQRQLRHDLRTPINAIKGYAEMLAEDLADDPGQAALLADFEKIVGEADGLLGDLDAIVRNLDGAANDDGGNGNYGDGGKTARDIDALANVILAPTAAKPVIKTGTILVVDDIEANRDVLSRRLGRDGHQVRTADGGRAALAALAEGDVDVVLLDLLMPDMSGLEVLRELRQDVRLRQIPVIVVSALDETDSAIRCIEAGAEDYLPKPINPVLLRARLNACLERQAWRARERQYLRDLTEEKEKSDKLLRNILPSQIITRLNAGEKIIADRFENVAVLMADIVGFTALSTKTAPTLMVRRLNQLFSVFDRLCHDHGVEKIKTIGDAYLAVAGLPQAHDDPAGAAARMALGMIAAAETLNRQEAQHMQLRIGLHIGPVIAGIIGTHKFVYDVWGDTVNLASRMEANSLPDHINLSPAMARQLDGRFDLDPARPGPYQGHRLHGNLLPYRRTTDRRSLLTRIAAGAHTKIKGSDPLNSGYSPIKTSWRQK